MVLYQLESLNLVDYNLIYSQNKNRVFDKFLTAFPLKTKHFPFYKHFSKPISKPIYNQYKTPLSTFGVFPNPNTSEKGLGFSFLPLNLLILQHQAFLLQDLPPKPWSSPNLSSLFSLFALQERKCTNVPYLRPHLVLTHLMVKALFGFLFFGFQNKSYFSFFDI